METLGAELIFHGENFDAARMHGLQLSREEGYRFVHPVNEPLLIAGVATASLETIEDLPDVQVLVVPLGHQTPLKLRLKARSQNTTNMHCHVSK